MTLEKEAEPLQRPQQNPPAQENKGNLGDRVCDKECGEGCFQLLRKLHDRANDGVVYYSRAKEYPQHLWPNEKDPWVEDLEKINSMSEHGFLTSKPYETQYRKPHGDLLEVHLQPKAVELIRTQTMTRTETVTKTVTETVVQPEPELEPAWKLNEHRRQFLRTERGFGIMNSELDDFLDSIKSKVMKIRRGDLPAKDMKCLQIWLDRALEFRGHDFPRALEFRLSVVSFLCRSSL